jgi:hypothetical protein
MTDTDKYEGHTPAPWMNLGSDANSLLMQDAPKLLAEVKRLRVIAKTCLEAIEAGGDIRSGTIELIEHNLKLMETIE